MKITITDSRYTPTWETTQQVIRESLGHAEHGLLTRISRADGRCGYRDPGLYQLTFVPETGDAIELELEVLL